MKKFLLTAAACGIAMSSVALTTDHFKGKTLAVVLYGNDMQYTLPVCTAGSTISPVGNSNTVFQIDNFYNGFPVQASFSGENLAVRDFTGGYNSVDQSLYGSFYTAKSHSISATLDGQKIPLYVWAYPTGESGYGDLMSTDKLISDDQSQWLMNRHITPDSDNGYWMILHECFDVTNGIENAELVDIASFNSWYMIAQKTNSTATEYQGKVVADMYPVQVNMADGKISIFNFLNQGIGMSVDFSGARPQSSPAFFKAEYDANGNVTMPIQEVMADVDFGFAEEGDANCFIGTGYIWNNGEPEGYWFFDDGFSYYPWYLVDYQSYSYNQKTDEHSAAAISGFYTQGELAHNTTNHWHPNCGGDLSTSVNTTIELENVGIASTYWCEIVGQADRIVIETPAEKTADAALSVTKGSYWDENCSVKGKIKTATNTDNVDHFDIYAVPGAYTSIKDGGFFLHDENGNYDAVLVYDGSDDTDDHEYAFNANFTMPGLENGSAQAITLFAKANYKAETGLHPTFHALTTYSLTNSIEALQADDNTEVAPEYYNMQGLRIANPAKGQVVIERRGDKVTKITL